MIKKTVIHEMLLKKYTLYILLKSIITSSEAFVVVCNMRSAVLAVLMAETKLFRILLRTKNWH